MENKKIDIKKLREKVYEISNSKCPLDCFFNDIEKNDNPKYNKELAYRDLEIIADFIIELQNKDKTPTEEEIKKEWEAFGYEWIDTGRRITLTSKETFDGYRQITIAVIYKDHKKYSSSYLLDMKLNKLLTKTFKMLDWEV